MRCPRCREDRSKTIDSRPTAQGYETRRRLKCECGERFTTYERIEDEDDLDDRLSRNMQSIADHFAAVAEQLAALKEQLVELKQERAREALDRSPQTKLSYEDRELLRADYGTGQYTYMGLARKWGLSPSQARKIVLEAQEGA